MTTPPGWYDDGHGALRWWDGAQWTEHVAQPDPEPSDAPTEAEIVAAQAAAEQQAAAAEQQAAAAAAQAGYADQQAYASQQGYAPDYGHPSQQTYPAQPGYGGNQPGEYAPQAYGSYPPGYPQGSYPAANGGAFTAATGPRKSKLWIVWVVIGVVLLGLVVAAAVVIPLALLSAASDGGAQSAEEKAAVEAVRQYDDAWQQADCGDLEDATSEDFRAAYELDDCDVFEDRAATFNEDYTDYKVEITEVQSDGDAVTVATHETYTMHVDEDGEPIEATPAYTDYTYTVVESGGQWVIDDVQGE